MKSFRKEDVVGKSVIETTGSVKGKVTDVVFDLGGAVTLVVQASDGTESKVALSRVTGISEHVVVKSEQAPGAPVSGAGASCRFCGASMGSGAVWCPSCGRAQG